MPELDHLLYMRQCLALAQTAADLGEIPVGALVVYHPPGAEPRVIGQGYNRREVDADPSAHAEIVALRAAGKFLNLWRLNSCTLYVTLEPCPMCAGALVNSRIDALVYGCPDPKAGAVATLYSLCSDPRLNHRLAITSGVLADESALLLRTFFAARRGSKSPPAP